MRHPIDRRRFWTLPLALAAAWALPWTSLQAATGAAAAADAMMSFDQLYIPPLFLTGSAGKSDDGAARADAALNRLQSQWTALHHRLQAVWPADAAWRRTLDGVQHHIDQAGRLAAARRWADSHEALEAVRLELWRARSSRGMDYVLDRYTAFHESMEHLAAAGSGTPGSLTPAQRAAIEQHFPAARARWHAIESAAPDAGALGLTPAREAQLRKALADESAVLAALSQALRAGDAVAVQKAAAATKPPFVRAYTAFGLGAGEAPRS